MNLHYHRFFLLSGVISFFLFGLILAFVLISLLKSSKPIAFALTKSDVISVSLDDNVHSAAAEADVSLPVDAKPIEKTESTEEETKSTLPEINDLFATVKVTEKKPKSVDNSKQLSDLNALESKVMTSKRNSNLFDKAKTFDLAKSGVTMVASSSGPEVNEYNAKIQGIVYSNFHPASGTEGFTARVRITLSPDGHLLAYRVISYSGNAVFNAEVDWLKERLRQVALPVHPKGMEAQFEIILTAKD